MTYLRSLIHTLPYYVFLFYSFSCGAVEEFKEHFVDSSPFLKVNHKTLSFSEYNFKLLHTIEIKENKSYNFFCSIPVCNPNMSYIIEMFSSAFKRSNLRENNITNIAPDIILYISKFLNSIDILRFSGVNIYIRSIFDDNFWQHYEKNLPITCSYLTLNTSLSPFYNRKTFFSHLWYREERFNLAAKLGHPEAIIIYKYNIYIAKDQYKCPSGVIRHLDGEPDHIKTEKLEAIVNKSIKMNFNKDEKGFYCKYGNRLS